MKISPTDEAAQRATPPPSEQGKSKAASPIEIEPVTTKSSLLPRINVGTSAPLVADYSSSYTRVRVGTLWRLATFTGKHELQINIGPEITYAKHLGLHVVDVSVACELLDVRTNSKGRKFPLGLEIGMGVSSNLQGDANISTKVRGIYGSFAVLLGVNLTDNITLSLRTGVQIYSAGQGALAETGLQLGFEL